MYITLEILNDQEIGDVDDNGQWYNYCKYADDVTNVYQDLHLGAKVEYCTTYHCNWRTPV